MKFSKKTISIALGCVIILSVTLVVVVMTSLDYIVKTAIETIGSKVAGVKVTVSQVKLSISKGQGTLRGLKVANPPGFSTASAFDVANITLAFDTKAIGENPIAIKRIVIAKPEVTYEVGNGGSNISAIQDHISDYVGNSASPKTDTDDSSPKEKEDGQKKVEATKMKVDKLDFTGGKITLAMSGMKAANVVGTLDDIHLRNIGHSNDGVTAGELAVVVIEAISNSAVHAAPSLLSKNGLNDIKDLQKGLKDKGLDLNNIFK